MGRDPGNDRRLPGGSRAWDPGLGDPRPGAAGGDDEPAPALRRDALANGARGFVPKTSPAALLADVVRRVHAGGRYVDPDVAADALAVRENPLTDRERQVLAEVGDGITARSIARVVHLSPGTVRNYLSSAMAKLGVGTRWQAAERARDHGWI
ncbi:hypothetical protein C1701_16800 [Actinoalloteichus sp. AHMU CJ021]|nr:hypothetical protein C1701_16800 [Actinoalloteichus sp. AHMU CJ021]